MQRPVALLVFLVSSVSLAQSQVDIPLSNWTVPPYRAESSGYTTMVDQTPPRAFIGLPVCRLLDTRPPANNPLDGDGIFAADQIRTYTLPGSCGIPSGTDAVSLNVTVTNTGNHPFGHIKIWPGDQTEPNVSTLNWSTGGVTVANAAIVALSVTPAGQIKVKSGNAGSDVIIDTNGYFSDLPGSPSNQFEVRSSGGVAIFGQNTGSGYGVWGISATGFGVVAGGGAGGVWATTDGAGSGVYGQNTAGGYGVHGRATSTSGITYGVWGQADNSNTGTAGVFGTAGGLTTLHNLFDESGVIGESASGNGVVGITQNESFESGVTGRIAGAGGAGVYGQLGSDNGEIDYGVYSQGNAHIAGTITAAGGLKSFVQPHASDPSKEIRYVSLEGRNSEVYFRGTAQISRGITRIRIPDDFRMVATPGSYSTLVTPVGGMATVAVLSEGGDGIVVQASRNVKIHYVVYAEREAVKQENPIIDNVHFRPEPGRDLLAHLPESYRRLMIQNGTLNADGSVNIETARRLGWDKAWEKRGKPIMEPAPE